MTKPKQKAEEREQLNNFLEAYFKVTGEEFDDIEPSETPDFLCRDADGKRVGIEIVRIKFDPEYMWMRQTLMDEEWAGTDEVFFQFMRLTWTKQQKLTSGYWPTCQRKILVIVLIDSPIEDAAMQWDTDKPEPDGFDEVWFSDETTRNVYRGVDVYVLVHEELSGHFPVGSKDQKPYG